MIVAICDDNYTEVKGIEDYLNAHKIAVDIYDSGKSLVKAYQEKKVRYDAIFIDIEMDELDGFHAADTIYAIDDTVLIVFVTSHHEYIEEWFKFSGVWFLHKPVELENLEQALRHLKKIFEKRQQTFTFIDSHQSVRLRCDDILYFEAQSHNVIIHTKSGETYTIYKKLKEIEHELENKFCRVHDSYLVNMKYIKTMTNEESFTDVQGRIIKRKLNRKFIVVEHCSDPIPIGRAYKKNVDEAFLRFQEEKFII